MLNSNSRNMKKFIKTKVSILLVLAMMVLPFSCETPFDELNADPNQPTSANIDLVFSHGANNVLFKYGRFTSGSDWDFWAGLWTQTFAGNHGSGINFDQYVVRNTDALWASWWDGLLDLKYVIENGTTQEAWTHVGASQVVTALALGSLTSFYGDLPYSDGLQGVGNPYPTYDSQEEIYQSIFDLLDAAVVNLQKTSAVDFSTADIWMDGSAQKWLGAAYALQARYENHFSVKDPTGSAARALTAVANAKAAGFTSGSSDLVYPYSGNGTFQNGYFDCWENNQMIASKGFVDALSANNDPRLIAVWDSINFDGFNVGLIGKQNGFGTDAVSYSPVGPRTYYGAADSPQPIVTHFELLFIEAEAHLRKASPDAAAAATALNAAITAHVDLVTPAAIETLESESPGDVAGYETQIANYLSAYAAETSATVTLEKVMTQKHTAMVCMNGESWVDVRRHDYQYPSWLSIPADNTNTPIATDFIERVLYPQESVSTNPKNTPTNVTIFDRLWIFNP